MSASHPLSVQSLARPGGIDPGQACSWASFSPLLVTCLLVLLLAYVFFNPRAMQFSIIIKPLFESFKGMVSTSSLEELHRTALSWLDQHCSLPVLRPSE